MLPSQINGQTEQLRYFHYVDDSYAMRSYIDEQQAIKIENRPLRTSKSSRWILFVFIPCSMSVPRLLRIMACVGITACLYYSHLLLPYGTCSLRHAHL